MTKILNKRRVFSGKVTRIDEVVLDFENGKHATYEVVSFGVKTGVSALPVVGEDVLLIEHYLAGIETMGISIPTGGLHDGENPEERIQLELQEEIGYKAGKFELMFRSHSMPGYVGSEAGYTFLARDLTKSTLPGDEEYPITVVRMALKAAIEMVKSGKILDARTALALLYYEQFVRLGR